MVADFVPDNLDGKIVVYEYPDPNIANSYVCCVDPVESDDVQKSRDSSNLALAIVAKANGVLPARLVCEYVDRPKKVVEFYQQVAYILLWYRARASFEMNSGGWSMLRWFQENYPELLALLPSSYNSAKGGLSMSHGYRITPERKIQMKGLGEAYVENYWQYIPSIRLIDELKVVGAPGKDDDLAMAFLACLMILQGDRSPSKNLNESTVSIPTVHHEMRDGRIVLVSQTQKNITPSGMLQSIQQTAPKRSKSTLFKI
jgi:hypothetical protein